MHISLHRGIYKNRYISKISVEEWRAAAAQVTGLRVTDVCRWRNPKTGNIEEQESPGYSEISLDTLDELVFCYPLMGSIVIDGLTDPDHVIAKELASLLGAEIDVIDDEDIDIYTIRVQFSKLQGWSDFTLMEDEIAELLDGQDLGDLIGVGTESSGPYLDDLVQSLNDLDYKSKKGFPVLDLSFETGDLGELLDYLRKQLDSTGAFPVGSEFSLLGKDKKYEPIFQLI